MVQFLRSPTQICKLPITDESIVKDPNMIGQNSSSSSNLKLSEMQLNYHAKNFNGLHDQSNDLSSIEVMENSFLEVKPKQIKRLRKTNEGKDLLE